MLSMVFGLLFMGPIPLVVPAIFGSVAYSTGILILSFIVGVGIFLGGLDILTCDPRDSTLPDGGIVVVGSVLFGIAAGLYFGPELGIFSIVVSVVTGSLWRAALV